MTHGIETINRTTAAEFVMRLLIIGATGGTGLQVTRQAVECGHNVTAFVRSPQKLGSLRQRVAIVVSGFYLGARVGVLGNDWMRASYGALFLVAIVSGPVARSPMRALTNVGDVPADGTVALRAAAANPILRLSLRTRVAFGLAVVFLMIAKPAAGESLLVLALASMVTIATSLTRRTTPSTAAQGYR